MRCQRLALMPDLQAQAAHAVARLKSGALVVLPTETVYGVAADPEDQTSIARVVELKGRAAGHEFTYHLASRAWLDQLAPPPPLRIERLLARFWPGPLTLLLAGRRQGIVGARVPAHPFAHAVLAEFGRPLYLSSVNRTGEPPLFDPDEIVARFGERIDVLYDGGRTPLQQASTVARFDGRCLSIVRQGILSEQDLLRAAARPILFVCTGNTCRSPLASALATRALARVLGIEPGQLLAHGFLVTSAGLSTWDGMPASEGSIAAAAAIGLDLSGHRATQLTRELLLRAERVYAMTQGQMERMQKLEPQSADRIERLDPHGDIHDPYGGSLADYTAVRDQVAAAVDARVAAWVA
jgi:tRNA threonylcarbamoyl adenosine modification protein (Sua5/YciO/YrdC/YwlC family)